VLVARLSHRRPSGRPRRPDAGAVRNAGGGRNGQRCALGRVETKGVSQEAEVVRRGVRRRPDSESSHPGWADTSLFGQPLLGEGRR